MKERLKHLWDSILERVSAEVNAQSFQTWFKPTRLVSCENGHLVIEGPNPFFVDWLAEHHRVKIERAARETLGENVSVEFVSPASPPRVSPPEADAARAIIVNESVVVPDNAQLNARYVFDEFVVGSSIVSPTRRRSPSPTIPRAPTIRSLSTAARGSARLT